MLHLLPHATSWLHKALVVILLVIIHKFWKRKRLPLPPGPTPLPIIGNVHQVPRVHNHLTFAEWGKRYGPIVHLSIFGKPLIILTTPQAALDLLEKRGAMYANRPRLVMAGDIVGYVNATTLAPYDNRHREHRRLIYEAFSSHKAARYHEFGQRRARKLVAHLLNDPSNFRRHVTGYVAAVVFNASHGHEVTGHEDPFVALAEKCGIEFCEMVQPGAFLVDVLPLLRHLPEWFPFARFKHKARLYRETAVRMRDIPYDFVREQMVKGIVKPSLTTDVLEAKPERTPEEDMSYRWMTATIYAAGADTSSSTLSSFFLAMALNPEVQGKAQQELDRVLGANCLPTFYDRDSLPYTKAICIELLRLYYPAPTGLPHLAAEEDEYMGYRIPAGATVIANNWGILHDPDSYPEPEKFIPERYLTPCAGAQAPGFLEPRIFVFGYGRRACPGRQFAEDMIFIAVATILSLFDIRPAPSGLPSGEFTSNLVMPVLDSHPKPFECSIRPRFPAVEQLIRDSGGT